MHTFQAPLEAARQAGAAKLAVRCGEDRITNEALYERCQRLGSALRALGLEAGDRVAILALNCHRYLEAYVAVPASGLVIVPLNTRHAEAEVRYALEDSGAKVLLTDRDPGPYAEMVDHVIEMPAGYEALLAGSEPADFPEVDEDALAGLFYTGGTTGASKGVMLSHRNLIANTFHWIACSHPRPDDVYLVMAPLFHAAGSNGVLATVWTGGTHVMHYRIIGIGRQSPPITLGEGFRGRSQANAGIRFLARIRPEIVGGRPGATRRVSASLD